MEVNRVLLLRYNNQTDIPLNTFKSFFFLVSSSLERASAAFLFNCWLSNLSVPSVCSPPSTVSRSSELLKFYIKQA